MLTYSEASILNPLRRKESSVPNRSLYQEAVSDRARVVFSNPFRRLQQKAQVFPLEPNTAVRSRMTHSAEVAHIGRSLTELIEDRLRDAGDDSGFLALSKQIAQIVETACLLHDFGNPPFGHFGEEAVRRWFSEKGEECYAAAIGKATGADTPELRDFKSFDGNAQGLRLVTRLQWDRDEFGLNLMYPQLAAFLKYMRCSNEDKGPPFTKKAGWFRTEADIVEELFNGLKIPKGTRHPLVFITEAADDIAYCFSDLEDGLEKGVLSEDEFINCLEQAWADLPNTDFCKRFPNFEKENPKFSERVGKIVSGARGVNTSELPKGAVPKFLSIKTSFTDVLEKGAADEFTAHHTDILKGEHRTALLEGNNFASCVLNALSAVTQRHIYVSPEAENVEIAGFRVISGLLDCYESLLQCSASDLKVFAGLTEAKPTNDSGYARRTYNRLAPKYRHVYQKELKKLGDLRTDNSKLDEWCLRAHLVVDYIAGMTDQFALDSYQLFAGINIRG